MKNTCQSCGSERHPVAKPGNCKECHLRIRRQSFEELWIKQIQDLGYDFLSYVTRIGSHSLVTVKNNSCGHTFTSKLNNIVSRMTICAPCGKTARMRPAFDAWYAKNKRTYDLKEWKDYRDKVRWLSDRIYEANKSTMNPLDLPRCKPNTHLDAVNLDHVIPIIYGFKNGIPAEKLADLRNLRVVSARSNLRKKQKLTEEARRLLDELAS